MIASEDVPDTERLPEESIETSGLGIVSRSLYATGYYIAYTTVFPTHWVVSSLPRNNVAAHGIRDGAMAARETSRQAHQRVSEATSAAGQKIGDAYADVARKVQERVESVQDAVAERRHRRRLASA